MIRPFDLRRPSALGEVGALLGEYGDAAALYAGGTELLLLMKEGFVRPRVLVDVKRVPGLDRVTAVAGGIEIGATASHRSVERSEAVRAHAPLVAGVARHVANVRVRSVGTVGGNLAFADPHSDLATLFLVFDARVVLWSLAGERELPLADFVLGPL
jgi:carbon-monoxide dehydrogenase medium subunit